MDEYIDLDTPLELKVVWGQTYKPYTSTLRELLDINSIPYTAADVRPLVRGKWMHKKITADFHCIGQCSVCKEIRRVDNFCPNCGADMRGEN